MMGVDWDRRLRSPIFQTMSQWDGAKPTYYDMSPLHATWIPNGEKTKKGLAISKLGEYTLDHLVLSNYIREQSL